MRILSALLLSSAALVAGCAPLNAVLDGLPGTPPSCEVATVPAGAVFGMRGGYDIATWPPQIESGQSGCQRVWWGERSQPARMQVMATYYFNRGDVERVVGRVPRGEAYDCRFRDGVLDASASQNPRLCPKAADVTPGR